MSRISTCRLTTICFGALLTCLVVAPRYGAVGEAKYARSAEELRRTLAKILAAPSAKDSEYDAALRRLKAYRYLAEVPYADLGLDPELNKYAQAAAQICQRIKRLDHKPDNPGMPETEYQVALMGTTNSNLYYGSGPLARAVDYYMDDSDESNIAVVGHRRWCLNPTLGKVGFGKAGIYSALYCSDQSNSSAAEFDYVAWPPRGYMPLEFFAPNHAWSISLNPSRYQQTTEGVKAKIFAWNRATQEKGEGLKLNHHSVDTRYFAVPFCVVFRPSASAVAPGNAYRVEIDGLTKADGSAATVSYVVEFVRLGLK